MKKKIRIILVILEILVIFFQYSANFSAFAGTIDNSEEIKAQDETESEDKEKTEIDEKQDGNEEENDNQKLKEDEIENKDAEKAEEQVENIEEYKNENEEKIETDNKIQNKIKSKEATKEENEDEKQEDDGEKEQEQEKSEPVLTYSTHVQYVGWQDYVNNGETAGTTGKSLGIEAIKIKLDTELEGNIEYSTHVQYIGWQNYRNNGEIAGTTGKSLRVEAIKIRLTGEIAEKYDIYYKAHVRRLGWLDWAKNGEAAGSEGFEYRLEAIQIKLVEKGTDIKISKKPFVCKPTLKCATHVQYIGWQKYVDERMVAGTVGKGLSVEALRLKLENNKFSGTIQYASHIQNIGWQGYAFNGDESGTTGLGLRVEALKINLTGELSEYFDIYYRAHVQNMGWLAWAKNGEEAGTAGYSYRLEALQVQLVAKGNGAPGETRGHFYNKALERKSIEGIKLVLGNVCAGIDVSEHQGSINWAAIKRQADFAIIRCGYGQNFESQDDKTFKSNIKSCIANGIPVEIYLYSYADTPQKAWSEADHVRRLLDSLGEDRKQVRKVWYDVEDNSVFNQVRAGTITKETLGQIVDVFADRVRSGGYDVGLYTYSNALYSYFPDSVKNKYEIWIANYPGNSQDVFEASYNLFKTLYKMWQFTSTGVINGITGNVDLNIRF